MKINELIKMLEHYKQDFGNIEIITDITKVADVELEDPFQELTAYNFDMFFVSNLLEPQLRLSL